MPSEREQRAPRSLQMPWRERPFLCKIWFHTPLVAHFDNGRHTKDVCGGCGGEWLVFDEKKRRRYEEWAEGQDDA